MNSFTEYFLPLHENAVDLFACRIPERNPKTTIILPTGAKIEFIMLRFSPIFVSIIDAEKIVIVEITAEISKVVNDKLGSKAIYILIQLIVMEMHHQNMFLSGTTNMDMIGFACPIIIT